MSAITYKAQAERLASHLSSVHKVRLKHASALEAIAAVHAARDWNTLAAQQQQPAVAVGDVAVPGALAAATALERLFPAHSFTQPAFCDAVLRQSMQVGRGTPEERQALLCHLLRHQMLQGGGFLYIDAREEGARAQSALSALDAARDGRACYPVRAGSPNPIYLNALAEGDAGQRADVVLSVLPYTEGNPGADFYRQSARYVLVALFDALSELGQSVAVPRLAEMLAYPDEELIELEGSLPANSAARARFKLMLDGYRTGPGARIDAAKMRTVLGGVAGRLYSLFDDEEAPEMAKRHSWRDVIRDGMAFYASDAMGRFMVASLAAASRAVGEVAGSRPFTVFIVGPDAHEFLSAELSEALREAGIGLVVSTEREVSRVPFALRADVVSTGGFARPSTVRISCADGASLDARLDEYRDG
ncbi:glyoxalase superfamily protein [Burkholderia cenocepacia]|uniref:glyoxalase superfamily protein n=1 Tax=Burkholderia cenocepacia TaxID=95486 RepID=UPI0007619A27|nr:glyoxalase superfamily protein [Burkholderia cenocepacia]KWU19038.1 hypothetical protein AS149_12385 [Burkholderia cenocepacia]